MVLSAELFIFHKKITFFSQLRIIKGVVSIDKIMHICCLKYLKIIFFCNISHTI